MGAQLRGRCGHIVLSPLPTLARSRPTGDPRNGLAASSISRSSAATTATQRHPARSRPIPGPPAYPRPPPASPAPGLTEPIAERLAERADAADTRRLGHPDGWTPDGWTMDAGHPTAWTPDGLDTGRLDTRRLDTGRLDTGRLDHGRRPPGRLDRGRLDRRADAKQWARAGAGRRTGVLAFPTSATTLPISDRRPRIRRGRRRLRRSATRTAWR